MSARPEWLFPLFTDHDAYDRGMENFSDLHLYTGSKCNRSCDFCIVYGRPGGWYAPLTEETLDAALALVPPDGTLKFYGGEPTLDAENLIWAMRSLRERGFRGWFTVFSNGVLADRLIAILDADKKTDAVLNYSILHGEDAEPIPAAALRALQDYASRNPNRIYSSHAGVFPYGRGVDFVAEVGSEHVTERMHASLEKKIEIGQLTSAGAESAAARGFRMCPRCRPVVKSNGRHHACPFAVESDLPHFDLGAVGDPATAVQRRFQQFLDWIDGVLEPEAERRGVHPCQVCMHALGELPTYGDVLATASVQSK
jgi:hypothetical protein